MTLDQFQATLENVFAGIRKVIIGQEDAIRYSLVVVLSNQHALIEGVPGLAKTLLARTLAAVLGSEFKRIQFTPDLMPADITGTSVFNLQRNEFTLARGPLFTTFLLADEINRAPAKTQAALLEAMQERQVTVEGRALRLQPPFFVIATQNPIEYEGTYPLPEAQLDRFLLRIGVGYPTRDEEWEVLARRVDRRSDEVRLEPRVDGGRLLAMQAAIEDVYVADSVGLYMVDLVTATRQNPRILVGASPRGSLALLKLARSQAALLGRDYVTPEDVKAVAVPALAHRLTLRPELWVQRVKAEDVVRECLQSVPTPKADDPKARGAAG